MFRNNFKIISRVLMVMTLSIQLTFSGTTGKIAGQVIDKESGEPLPGAIVLVEGTTLGASSDADGLYTILQVPPGVYTVKTEFVGYAGVIIRNARVRIDQTTRIDFRISEQAIEGEEVIVIAEQKLVQKDVSSSVSTLSGDDVEALPLTSVSEAVQLQAGVEDGLVIRGGGADEALFLVDGIALRDARNNQPITGIALSAVQEVSLERGGFNAEYGQVRSGLVNVVTKEGDKKKYSGSVTFKYSPPAAKHFDISPFDPNSMWLRPYLDPDVSFVGTQNGAWDEFTRRQFPQFDGWNVVSQRLLSDDDPTNDLSPGAARRLFLWQHRKQEITDQPDYDIDAGFGGPVPFVGKNLGNLRFFASLRNKREMLLVPLTRDDFVDYDGSLKLTSDISPSIKLNISGFLGKSNNIAINGTEQRNSTDYIRTPSQIAGQIDFVPFTSSSRIFSNSFYSLAEVQHLGIAADLSHVLSSKTYYDLSVEYFQREYTTGPTGLRDQNNLVEIAPGLSVDPAPFGWSPNPDVGVGDGILFGGHTSTARDSSKTSSFKVKFNLTSQVNFNNQIKTGFEFVRSSLDLKYGTVNLTFPESNNFTDESFDPVQAAFYLQDKLEFKGFIANMGVRLDFSDANTDWVRTSPFDKNFFSARFNADDEFNTESAKAKWSISPRLGISHPITDNSKLFFNYGHFKQLPTYEELFLRSRGASKELRRYGDPNLDLAKTISYELGYDHSLFDNHYLIQLAGFYHDIQDQLAFSTFRSADGSITYQGANNSSYEDIRGFELTLRKVVGKWWRGFGTYTYQVTTSGRFGRDEVFEDPSEQRKFDSNVGNFSQSRPVPQPRANFVLTFLTPTDFGPAFAGGNLLGNWSLTLLGDWQSGFHTTWNPNQVPFVAQNVQVKDRYNFNLRMNKRFNLGRLNATFFIDVNNLLNTRRLSLVSFFDFNDQLDYFNSLHFPESNAYNNIIGDDRPGDFREPGVEFQPVVQVGSVDGITNPGTRAWYFESTTGRYMNFVNGAWSEVDGGQLTKALDDKAYIDMPNQTSFNFLDPRDVFFGLRTTFDLR